MIKRFKKGNGAAFIAIYLMFFMMACTMVLIHNVTVYQRTLTTQTAIDSVADGAAMQDYLDRAEYDASLENIDHMVELVRQFLGIELKNVTSDPESYERREVVVRGTTSEDYYSSFLGTGTIDITRDATTQFARRSYGEDMITFMESVALNDIHGYSMDSRDLRDGNSTDCSGLVYFATLCTGYPVGPEMFYSGDIASRLQAVGFERIPITNFNSIQDFLPGDVLYYSAADHGTEYGHVETVYSTDPNNILTIGAHGTYDRPEDGDQSGNEISIRPATFDDLRYGLYVAVLRPTAMANQLRNTNRATWPTIWAQTH